MASVSSQGHSTPICSGFGRAASVTSQVAHSKFAASLIGLRPQTQARGRGDLTGPAGAASDSSPLTVPQGAPGRPGFGSSGLVGQSLPRDDRA